MFQPISILQSKLLTPRLYDTIERRHLYALFDDIVRKKLFVVTAGAGYGKSTLVAQALRYMNIPMVWYRLDDTDSDLITFLHYLIEGIRKYYPEFGNETFLRLAEVKSPGLEKEALLGVFLSELQKVIVSNLVVVLDDYHMVQESPEIKNAITFFLHHFPRNVQLVLISRLGVNLSLSRFIAGRVVTMISEKELAFSPEEIRSLYRKLLHIDLDERNIETLLTKTSGWVACLILLCHTLKGKKPGEIESGLATLAGSQTLFFQYLQENVFEMLPEDKKDFLLKTSILHRLSVGDCNHLLGVDNSGDILKNLENDHLLTFSLDEEGDCFCYHQLFQDFLQARLNSELDGNEILKLHQKAAELYETNGELELALVHYLSADRMKSVYRLISRIGSHLAQKGRLQFINSFLSKIPHSHLNEPWIQYMAAHALALSGRSHDAVKQLKISLKSFRKFRSSKGEALCLSELGRNYFQTGDLQNANNVLKELILKKEFPPDLKIEVLSQLIFISSYMGDMEIADTYYHEALQLLPENEVYRDINRAILFLSLGFRYHFSGDFDKAIELAEQAKEIVSSFGIYRLMVLYYQLMSSIYYFLGRFTKGLTLAKEGLQISEERGFQDSRAWLQLLCSTNSARLGNIDAAIQYARACRKGFHGLANLHGLAGADLALIDSMIAAGNLSDALLAIKNGTKITESFRLPMIKGELNARMAEVLIRMGQFEDVPRFLEQAKNILSGFKWYHHWVLCFYTRYYWESGRKDLAVKTMKESLSISEKNNYDCWIAAEKEWMRPLLLEIAECGHMQPYIRKILMMKEKEADYDSAENMKEDTSATVQSRAGILNSDQASMPPGMRVHLFGKFRLFIGDKEIPDVMWKSNKAMMLFKFLVHSRSRGYVNKEVLMEMLWPDGDPAKTTNRFHVAMNALRKTLEPELNRARPSAYVLSRAGSYQVSIGTDGYVDTDLFLERLSLAKKENNPENAIGHYLQAESIYKGDFLADDPYAEWCLNERDRFKKEYLHLIGQIVTYYEKKSVYEKCIDYADTYLRSDPYDEGMYQRLMVYYSKTGNKAMVARTFEQCKRFIQNELNCPLSEETAMSFKRLMNN